MRLVNHRRDPLMQRAINYRVIIVFSVQQLHARIHPGPGRSDVYLREFLEKSFAPAWIGRRRSGRRAVHTDPSDVSLCCKQGREHTSKGDADQIDAVATQQRGGIAKPSTLPGSRRTLP